MNQEIIRKLKAPFPFDEIEAKIQVTTQDKAKGMVVFYLTARAIQDRLDEVIGPMNWKNSFTDWKNGQAQLCGIAIYDAERKEWVSKFDGSDNSEIEPTKGGLSDALKRAACVWGIGRYLYQIDGVWVEVEQRGKGTYIKDSQQHALKAAYDKAVDRIFGTATKTNPVANVADSTIEKRKQPTQQMSEQPVTPPVEEPIYQIKSAKMSGTSSQVLELVNNKGEVVTAYIKAGDAAIKPGTHLRDIKIEKRKSEYGEFNIVAEYQIAA